MKQPLFKGNTLLVEIIITNRGKNELPADLRHDENPRIRSGINFRRGKAISL